MAKKEIKKKEIKRISLFKKTSEGNIIENLVNEEHKEKYLENGFYETEEKCKGGEK